LSANDKQKKKKYSFAEIYMILRRKRIYLFIKHLYNNDLHNHKFNTLLQTNCSDIYVDNRNSNSTFFIIFRSSLALNMTIYPEINGHLQ